MIRMSFAVAVTALLLTGSNAFAQGNPPHNAWCLQLGTGTRNCVFASQKQCEAARHGGAQHCSRNRMQ
jgi:hypothetical protein